MTLPEQEFHLFEMFAGEAYGIVTVKTCGTIVSRFGNYLPEPLKAQIGERISGHILPDLIKEMGGGY